MTKRIYVNLPVKDLEKSMKFFSELGFTFNKQFTDDKSTCMILGENIFAMLLKNEFFAGFSKREVPDTSKTSQVLIVLDAESREAVDEMVRKAVAAGGTIYSEPHDYGWYYFHCFADLDGHQWEFGYTDESKMPK